MDLQQAEFKIKASVTGQDSVDRLTASVGNLGRQTQGMAQTAGVSAAQTAAAFRALPAQFTDIATQLAGGQNPMLILLQQGGQIKDMFGGIGPAFKALTSLITPARVAMGGLVTAVASFAFAAYEGAQESSELSKSIALTGGYAGDATVKFEAYAAAIKKATGATSGNARDIMAGLVGTGAFGPDSIQQVASAAARIQKLSGESADAVIKDFASMGKGVAAWAAEHNRQYHYLTVEQYRYIESLEKQGQTEKAMAENAKLLDKAMADRIPNLGYLERAWNSVKDKASDAWKAMKGFGSDDTLERQLERARGFLKKYEDNPAAKKRWSGIVADLESQLEAMATAANEKARKEAEEQRKIQEDASGETLARERNTNTLRMAQAETASAKRMEIIKRELATLEGKHRAELVTEEDYTRQKAELDKKQLQERIKLADIEIGIAASATAKTKSEEIARAASVEKMKAKRAELVAEMKAIDAGAQFTSNKPLGEYEKATKMIEAQTRALFESNEERQITLALQELENKNVKKNTEEYNRAAANRIKAIKEQNEAQRSWQYGVKSGFEEYYNNATNTANQVKGVLTSAFKGAEDAMVEFVKTGKLNFQSLLDTILTGIIRIQAQKAIAGMIDNVGGTSGILGGLGKLFGGGGDFGATSNNSATMIPDSAWSSFAGGGYTGNGARSGGLDGQGGYLAMIHPQETVVDHAQGQSMGGANVSVNVINQTGQNVTAEQQGGPKFDGEKWVLSVVMKAANTNQNFRAALGVA